MNSEEFNAPTNPSEDYFGQGEIARVKHPSDSGDSDITIHNGARESSDHRSFHRALAASAQFDASGFYQSGRERRKPVLVRSYNLFLAIVKVGDWAVELLLQQPPLSERRRKISRSKLELIALEVTAKPTTESQRKQCSSFACVLKAARQESVTIEAFPDWLDDVNIKECRRRAVNQIDSREGQPPLDAQIASKPKVRPWLRIAVGNELTPSNQHQTFFPEATLPVVQALIEAAKAGASYSEVLRRLADAIKADGSSPIADNNLGTYDTPIEPSTFDLKNEQARTMNWIRYGPPSERDI